MHCVVTVILLIICIVYLIYILFCRKSLIAKQKGGYAGVLNDNGVGTVIEFPVDILHKPIVIRQREGAGHLNLYALYNDIAKQGEDFIDGIKRAVTNPCRILRDEYLHSTIYAVLNKNKMYTNPLFTRIGECRMDGILHVLCPLTEKFDHLKEIRDSLIAIVCNCHEAYIIDEMTSVSQGDSVGHKINSDIGGKYIYMYGENLDTREPNIGYEQLIDDYILSSELTLLKNGKKQTIYFDPISRYVFDNEDVRNWYGKNKAAYTIMNPQYIRPNIVNDQIEQSLILVLPDRARSKVPNDNIADIIPAGSVRQSIMLYLKCLLSTGWPDSGIWAGRLSIELVLEHISYITLLCGIANAFGDTTHWADYNTGIGDKYRYIGNPLCEALLAAAAATTAAE